MKLYKDVTMAAMIKRRSLLQGMRYSLIYAGIPSLSLVGRDTLLDEEMKKIRLAKLGYVLNPPQREQYADIKMQLYENAFVYIHPRNKSLKESKLIEIIPEPLFEKIINNDNTTVYIAPRKYIIGNAKEKLTKMAENNTLPPLYPLWVRDNNYFIPLGIISLEPKIQEDASAIIAYGKNKKLELIEHDKELNLMRFRLLNISDFVSPFDATRNFLKEGKVAWCEPDFAFKIKKFRP